MILEACIGLGALLLLSLYYKLSKNKYHWADRGVPSSGFRFFWGNDKEFVLGKKSLHATLKEEYNNFPGERFYGRWTFLGQPILILRNDFDLIRAVWIKDFDHFTKTRFGEMNEGIWPSSRAERLAIDNITALHGDTWKDLRY